MIYKILRCLGVYTALSSGIIISYLRVRYNNIINKNLDYDIKRKINSKIFINTTSYFIDLLYWIKFDIDGKCLDLDKKNYIITSNHVSYFDFFVYLHMYNKIFKYNENLYYITVEYFKKIPILGYLLENTNSLFIKVNRENENNYTYYKDNTKKLYNNIKKYLENKKSIIIFPEGRLNLNPKKMLDIKNGAYNISNDNNVPIKIICSKGINNIWCKNGHPIGKGTITIKIFDKEYNFKNKEEYKEKIRNNIEKYISNSRL
jgi:1-acyl-sn-glycerol-3-phosphate acyltransferase